MISYFCFQEMPKHKAKKKNLKKRVHRKVQKIKELTDTEYIEAVWGIGFKLKGDL